MRATPVNLIGGFYADDTRPWSVQDTVNWLPVAAEVDGTLTPSKLSTPPGLKPYQKIGTGPIRGMYNCEGQMFVVSGRTMYRISNAGVGIPVGTIPGVGRVSIGHNQFKGGNQVLVTNGSPGGGYVYDTQTQQFNRISDPGFPGSLMTAYVDSYLLGVEPKGRFWFHSNLADANDYNTLDRYEAEAAPDRIVGIAVSQFEVWVFGERTTECFGNTGGATGTFQSRRTSIERGCASRWTIQNLDNSVFWLGDDGIVYRLEGYGARRVSTVPLERAISVNRLQDAFAFTWEDKGHKVYYLTMPDGHTWGYDVVSGIWHRRESYGLTRWRLNDAVRWNGAWYGGDFQDGRIWQLDWDYPGEGAQPMVSERTSPVMHDAQSAFNLTKVELIMGVGQQSVALSGDFPSQPDPPGPILPPQLSDWRYLQVDRLDDTDYSAPDVDDSGWLTGAAPFGGWEDGYGPTQIAEGAPDGFNFAPAYDARFAAKFATTWQTNTRLWLRREMNLQRIPPGGIKVIAYIEDNCRIYFNGNLVLATPEGHTGGTGQTFILPATGLQVGSNEIAIRCDDEPPASGISVVYADFIIEEAA